MDDFSRYRHGVPPWAEDDFLGFYVERLSDTDVEIWLARMAWLKRKLGLKRFEIAMRVLYANESWQTLYHDVGLSADPLDWAGVIRALAIASENLEQSIKHSVSFERWAGSEGEEFLMPVGTKPQDQEYQG